jgi:hypothetical protein
MEQQHCKPQRQDLNLAKNYSTFSTRRRRRKEEKSLGKEEERCKNIYKKKALKWSWGKKCTMESAYKSIHFWMIC